MGAEVSSEDPDMTPSRSATRSSLLALAAAAAVLLPTGAADANSIEPSPGISLPVDAPPLTDTTTPGGVIDMSSDNRLIVYSSNRPDEAPGVDTNGAWDLFTSDILDFNDNVRLPLVPGGQSNGDSFDPSISGDGRFVAFESRASNLVPDDTNGEMDVFVLDRDTDANGVLDEAGKTSVTRVSVGPGRAEADGPSYSPSISDDGRTVAFASEASNLAPGDGTPNIDVYVRNLDGQTTTLLSAGAAVADSSWAPSVSRDG